MDEKELSPEAESTPEETAPAVDETDAPDTSEAEGEKTEAPGEPSEEELLRKENEELKKQLADLDDRYKRLDAEYYNYRTRSVKEKSEAYESAAFDAVSEILPVIDNFERALAAECADEGFKKGVELIFKQYQSILEKLGVKEIDAQGQPFDPNLHNAVSSVEDESLGENTVAAVLQKGYIKGDKVIRHAMVTVANP